MVVYTIVQDNQGKSEKSNKGTSESSEM
jgi:hypothetical protein